MSLSVNQNQAIPQNNGAQTKKTNQTNNRYDEFGALWDNTGKAGGQSKLIFREVDGKKTAVYKMPDGSYWTLNPKTGIYSRVNVASNERFHKKTFTSTEHEVRNKPANVNSSEQEKKAALKELGISYSTVKEQSKKNNSNQEPVNINNLSNDDVKNLENGTPVSVSYPWKDGKNHTLNGIMFNGMLVGDYTTTAPDGREVTKISAHDPAALRKGDRMSIGRTLVYEDGNIDVQLPNNTSSAQSTTLAQNTTQTQTPTEKLSLGERDKNIAQLNTVSNGIPTDIDALDIQGFDAVENTADNKTYLAQGGDMQEVNVTAKRGSKAPGQINSVPFELQAKVEPMEVKGFNAIENKADNKTYLAQNNSTSKPDSSTNTNLSQYIEELNSPNPQNQVAAMGKIMTNYEELVKNNPKPTQLTTDNIINDKDRNTISDGTYVLVQTPKGANIGGRIIGGKYILTETKLESGTDYSLRSIDDITAGKNNSFMKYMTYNDDSKPQIALISENGVKYYET